MTEKRGAPEPPPDWGGRLNVEFDGYRRAGHLLGFAFGKITSGALYAIGAVAVCGTTVYFLNADMKAYELACYAALGMPAP